MTDLTIEQLQRCAQGQEFISRLDMAKQLLGAMRREGILKAEMEIIAKPALGGKQQQYRAQAILKELYTSDHPEQRPPHTRKEAV